MAPSSSSHLIPSRSSFKSWNYEVYLNFRGEDTRKTFVDHLYASLVQQGIHTCIDEETLARGEPIGPSLLKAIRESRITVIVFSENYADSSWCLDELAYIMECRSTRGQIVMPVFYDVDPLDVIKQKGKYGEAFAKHELKNKQKVELWKNALAAACNLTGWVTKDFANGNEAKCIKDIVGSISKELPLPLISKVSKDLIGIETRLQDLKSKLETGSSGAVRIVGIWGIGGGGKTTLASAAYTEMYMHFEGHCFLENIREESRKHGLKMLQENMLSSVLKTEVAVQSVEEGRRMIKERLCHKKVLVVLDDVDDLKQIEYLAGSHDWFGEGSRIIITTRDERMLTRKADSVYRVSLLSHDEAIELFHTHAYREDNPGEDYEILSETVVSYAGGLPLVLEVLGKFLYGKDKDEWKSALTKLKDIPDHNVMKILKISYDALNLDEKRLFLDIAYFHRKGTPIDDAMKVLDACGFNPVIGVRALVQTSLIYESNGVFVMHDLIEDMAHHIVDTAMKVLDAVNTAAGNLSGWVTKDYAKASSSVITPELQYAISPNGTFRASFKNWQKGKFLGSGSFGTVYEGLDESGFFFAVKEVSLLDQSSQGKQSIVQLEQEISLLRKFHHENIVQYLGTDSDDGKLYIFLELVTKGSLSKLYQNKKYDLRDSQVSAYTRQILSGLNYLHERKIVHRDIKCANILVDASGSVKLADFGLAKVTTTLNDIKSFRGTPYWMAPEVANCQAEEGYGLAVDIWSLGCTVLEMLTRKIPDYGVEGFQAVFRIRKGELPKIPNTLSAEARDFILKCLKVNPNDRPTAAQLLEHPFLK